MFTNQAMNINLNTGNDLQIIKKKPVQIEAVDFLGRDKYPWYVLLPTYLACLQPKDISW